MKINGRGFTFIICSSISARLWILDSRENNLSPGGNPSHPGIIIVLKFYYLRNLISLSHFFISSYIKQNKNYGFPFVPILIAVLEALEAQEQHHIFPVKRKSGESESQLTTSQISLQKIPLKMTK